MLVRMVWFLVLILVIAIALAGAIYLKQEELIFYPQPLDTPSVNAMQASLERIERFQLLTSEGVKLRGWLLRGSRTERAPLLMYFGGNAEEVSWVLPELARLSGWAALVMNYRGYGESEGHPSEHALLHDAVTLYDQVITRSDIDPHGVVAMGRSLGSGVATALAAQRPIAGVVLVSPYDSLVSIAQSAYPFLPVRFMLRHRFDSIARAPAIKAPLLAIAAAQDGLIPPALSRRLVEAWGGPARLEVLEGRDHNNVHLHPLYWSLITQFLASL